jgi:hypothetical protein
MTVIHGHSNSSAHRQNHNSEILEQGGDAVTITADNGCREHREHLPDAAMTDNGSTTRAMNTAFSGILPTLLVQFYATEVLS